MTRPLALDVDGTLTRPDDATRSRALDPRVFEVLPHWDEPVVLATGKSFPYPVALCGFLGLPERVVAETGGVVYVDGDLRYLADRDAVDAVVEQFRAAGHDLGWGKPDTVNRWRETDVAVSREAPVDVLREITTAHGCTLLDSGYAYHVLDPSVSKGKGLRVAADVLDLDPSAFVAVGDSENDAAMFEVAGDAYAVANADETAMAAADEVTEGAHADGLLEVLGRFD